MNDMVLTMKQVEKRYRNVPVLQNITMDIPKGAIYGLVGNNGAGKSTLMRLVSGQSRMDRGEIRLFGKIPEGKEQRVRHRIGTLIEEPGFYGELSAVQNLEYYRLQYGIPEKDSIDRLLDIVGLGHTGKKKYRNFSMGMKQRLGLALALLPSPEFLILDEPTSGLDPGERVRFRNLLSEFAHDRIVVISTHIVPDVEYIAMKNAIMKDGRIIETGTTQELVTRMEGKVFSEKIPAGMLMEYEKRLRIVNLKNEPDGEITIRYLGDKTESGVWQEPRLEDLYLWLFPQGTDKEGEETDRTEGGKKR